MHRVSAQKVHDKLNGWRLLSLITPLGRRESRASQLITHPSTDHRHLSNDDGLGCKSLGCKSRGYRFAETQANRHAVRAPGRPGRTRRGVKVGIRFRLQGRFTAPSRQSPQVERKSDQSTRRRPSPTQQFSFTLDGNSSWLRPDGTDALQRLTGLFRPSRCIRSRQQDGDMTELATGGLR